MIKLSDYYVEDAASTDASVSMPASDFVGGEQAWNEKKEADMKEQARYREELLQVKRRKAETARFGERIRVADMLTKDEPMRR